MGVMTLFTKAKLYSDDPRSLDDDLSDDNDTKMSLAYPLPSQLEEPSEEILMLKCITLEKKMQSKAMQN